MALKGPTETPVGTGHRSVNVELRKTLDLYANLRPVKTLPGVKTRYDGVDLVVVRENTEDLYSGLEHVVVPGVVESIKIITEKASPPDRPLRLRLRPQERAQARHRRAQGQHHEAVGRPLPRLLPGRWRKDYPEIKYDEIIVDNCCMQLVLDPTRFDMLLLENLYGDIVSDLCAGLHRRPGHGPGREHRRARAPSSRPCTAARPTSRARTSRTPWPSCSPRP